jgi:hypothetical protein
VLSREETNFRICNQNVFANSSKSGDSTETTISGRNYVNTTDL